ncbi:hypothetical protein [Streptomyces olivochromogenes]|uniref:hypothetical protein n=1 Tax=Streptomyces olivochromogenes TaxID=1963 RepID=UPI001F30B5DA|nr:hypothetical protein [Streptomyces olivochromogenes]
MLRIIDARTGEPVEAAPARRGLTRVQAHASGFGPTALRVLLTADVLVRALELGGTPVWAMLSGHHEQAELRAAATTLGIRPFEDAHDLASGLGEAQVIHVAGEGDPLPPGGVVVGVAPVSGPTARDTAPGAPPSSRGTVPDRGLPADLPDPSVLRLALLASPRGAPVRLDADALDEAGRTLARWRRAVALWARQPSRPVPDDVRGRLRAAWEDDLNVPEVLSVLNSVETAPALSDGARFETYAYTDRLLGLDVARDLGSFA